MTERIISLLKADAGVSDYRINILKRESYELFFVHRDLETVRATDTTDIKVTVFVTVGDKLGDATFSVYSSYTDGDISAEIEKAKAKAALAANLAYPLPSNEEGQWHSPSNFTEHTPQDLAAMISKAVFSADSYENGSINALEIFVYTDRVTVINSRGINKTELRHSAMVEAIPTWNGENESVELYECSDFTEFSAEKVSANIDAKMQQVRDRLLAKKPQVAISCPVVLPAQELSGLFSDLAYNMNYAAIYKHTNAFKSGDSVQKDLTGDPLTLTMKGQMAQSTGSAAFDGEGFTTRDAVVIEKGVAANGFGSVRYAHYLGKEPTGNLACLRAECGTLSDEELKSAPYFRCASMSGIQVDVYNDYIGGEVRLAYYFDGEKEIPVTGISISGKLSAALSSMRLSSSETTHGRYSGPAYAAFEGIEIV